MDRLDALFAFAIGPSAWAQHGARLSRAGRASLMLGLTGVAGLAVTLVGLGFARDHPMLLLVAVASAMLLGASSLDAARGRKIRARASLVTLARVAALGVLAVASVEVASGWEIVLFWPLALYIGVENAVTSEVVAHAGADRSLVREVLTSPMHLGLVSGLVAGLLFSVRTGVGGEIFELIALTEIWLLLGLGVQMFVGATLVALEDDVAARAHAHEARAGRKRAHWLHDDVCAEVRALQLRLATGTFSVEQMKAELDDLEFRLRTRQLDEVLSAGEAHAAEVIQPYVRRLQSIGVEIRSMPRFEESSIVLDRTASELLRSATAGLTANASDAGASWVSIAIAFVDGSVTLTVEDNAGGFDIASVPAGRGLHALREQLGEGCIHAVPTADGSAVTVAIPLRSSPADGLSSVLSEEITWEK